jgi:hypothetical protein
MNEIHYVFISLIFGFSIIVAIIFHGRKSWLGLLLASIFLSRAVVAVIFESGIKYDFVLDSLTYEYRAWLLAQPWMSTDIFRSLSTVQGFNYYERLLTVIFQTFGKDTLLAALTNCFLSVLTIFGLYNIQSKFMREKNPDKKNAPGLYMVIILALYPSYIVWSATNIRDTLYFFASVYLFYFFFLAFSQRAKTNLPLRTLAIVIFGFFYWLVVGVRFYVGNLFVASLVIGTVLKLASRYFKIKTILIFLASVVIGTGYAWQISLPARAAKSLALLQQTRLNFANLNLLDSFANSSFDLDQTFKSVTDILIFLPNALTHYFLGPFVWEINGVLQLFSLFEAFAVYLLIYPTLLGIQRIYRRAPFETLLLLSFVTIFITAQALVISNMGTIYRHRTLTFLFFSIFTGEGVNEIFKKYIPIIFKAQYRRPGYPRRKSFLGLEPFWI